MELYKNEYSASNPTSTAQRCLMGRTHYVDPDTLRFHKAKVLSTHICDYGLIFALVESCAADMNNTRRGFRYAIFDIFGTMIDRPQLKDIFSSRKYAERAMWAVINGLDAKQITTDAIDRAERQYADEMKRLRETLAKLA